MKRTSLCILMVLFSLSTISHATQFVSSKISEVTLFSNQAMVVREGKANLKLGLNELLIETMAFKVDKDALSAQIFGSGEMISVQIKPIPLSDFPQEQIQNLQEKLRKTKQSRKVLSDKKATLTKKTSFLDGLVDFSKTQIPKDVQTHFPNIENIRETLELIGSTSNSIHTENQALDVAIEKTDREIERLKKELFAVRGRANASKHVIEILFNATQEETVNMRVQYLVKKAFWQPLYKVNVPADLSGLDLTMLARISQKSGENWQNIILSISNVIPVKGIRLPEISAWRLDLPRAHLAKTSRDRVMTKAPATMELEEDTSAAEATMPAAYASTLATKLPLSFEYRMPYPVDIESRNQFSILPLLTKKMSGDFFHYSVPGKTGLTFLVAEATADKELLEGKLNVFFGGRYIGDTLLSEKKPSEPFFLNLGADRDVKVRRVKIKDQIKETYFGTIQRNTVVRSLSYKITAENIKDQSVTLKIIDRVPISTTDKIEVKDIQITPTPTKSDYQNKKGVHLWAFQLAPHEIQEIVLSFTVVYPKESPPFGL